MIRHLAENKKIVGKTLDLLHIYELKVAKGPMKLVCGHLPYICEDMTMKLTAKSNHGVDMQRFKVYIGGHFPSGGSMMTHLHYGQLIESDNFQEFDYGTQKNKKKYGQKTPPVVDLQPVGELGIPIAMFVGDEDELADVEDNRWL